MISFMRAAYEYAWYHSEDPNTKCGALILGYGVVTLGANRFPPGSTAGEDKLTYIEHAERSAIYTAARDGVCLQGSTMVAPWACCAPCARAIVLSGITKVVAHQQAYDKTPERWQHSIAAGLRILAAAGVEYELLDIKVGYCKNLFDGKVWEP